jgi:hypothetical protein
MDVASIQTLSTLLKFVSRAPLPQGGRCRRPAPGPKGFGNDGNTPLTDKPSPAFGPGAGILHPGWPIRHVPE